MSNKPVTFKVGDEVELTPEGRGEVPYISGGGRNTPQYATIAQRIGLGPFKVHKVMSLPTSATEGGRHHQRIKVVIPETGQVTYWFSGYWFQLAQ